MLFSLKKPQKEAGHQFKQQRTHTHDGHGGKDRQPDSLMDALFLSGAIIIGDQRHHGIVQAKYGHKDKVLQLAVYAEYCGSCGGKSDEYLVEQEVQHRSNADHEDGWEPDAVDLPYHSPMGPDLFQVNTHVQVLFQIHDQAKNSRRDLPCHRGHSRSRHLHSGKAQQTKDQNGIQNDVDNGAEQLGHHGDPGTARCLKHPLKAELKKDTRRKGQTNGYIIRAVANNLLHIRKGQEISFGAGQSYNGKKNSAD